MGEEFSAENWMKLRELGKIIGGFGCRLIQKHRGHYQETAHLERCHRTDDEKFYIPRVLSMKTEADLLNEAMGYICYDNVRGHSYFSYQTPFAYLKSPMRCMPARLRSMPTLRTAMRSS